MDVYQIIKKRISVRRYDMDPLPAEKLAALQEKMDSVRPLIPDLESKYLLVEDGSRIGKDLMGLPGGYGKIISAPHYMAALCNGKDAKNLIDCAYQFEQIILSATELGLSTCWIGGMHDSEKILEELSLPDSWLAMCVSPVGYPSENLKGKIINAAIRGPNRAGKRLPMEKWAFKSEWGKPHWFTKPGENVLRRILKAVQAAPSWANMQPWRFVILADEIILAVDTRPGKFDYVKSARNKKRYYYVDGGIALCHFNMAAEVEDFPHDWKVQLINEAGYGIPEGYEIIARLQL